jgi:nucleoside-diphosphate-sugar epimerase
MASHRKNILVTGAAGLIGREVVLQLTAQGHTVVGVDNCQRHLNFVPSGTFIKQDLIDYLKSTVNKFDVVYHMAAINGTTSFYTDPNLVLSTNVMLDLAIFQFVETNPNTKLIYASSSEVVAGTDTYPTNELVDVTITNIHNPRWSYRLPKVLSENYLANSRINYATIRFFNVFSEHSGNGHFVRDVITNLRNGKFELFGADETRSFCYVTDAVDAMIMIEDLINCDIVNIGSSEEIKIIDAAKIIADALNITVDHWNISPSKIGSVKRRCPDITKLKQHYPTFNPRPFAKTINSIKGLL